jgi:cytochrome d ubiquinol oxidase subunit I
LAGLYETRRAYIWDAIFIEGVAFFIEAIALGFFLYGWNKLNNWVHWTAGVDCRRKRYSIGNSGSIRQFVDEQPFGFRFCKWANINIDPVKAMFNKAWFSEALHMTIAAFSATGFAVAGIHALMIYRKKNVLSIPNRLK